MSILVLNVFSFFYFVFFLYSIDNFFFFFFFQAEDGIRDKLVTGVQTCALPICSCTRHTLSLSGKVKRCCWKCGNLRRFYLYDRNPARYDSTNGHDFFTRVRGRSEEHTSELQSLA